MDDADAVVPVFGILVKVQEAAAAQGGVALQRQPGGNVHTSRKLHAGAVGVRDVGCQRFANVAHFSGLYQLILVAHIIEVGAEAEGGAIVLIASFKVKQALCARSRVFAVVREVVALRLTMAHRSGGEQLVGSGSEGETGLGVEEIVGLIHVQYMLGGSAVLVVNVFVVVAVRLVVDAAVLDIAKGAEFVRQRVGSLHKSAAVKLGSIGIVILVIIADAAGEFLVGDICQVSEVIAKELLYGESCHGVPAFAVVTEVGNEAESVLAKAFLAHEIALGHLLAVLAYEIGNTILDQFVLVAEFIVVTVSVGVMGNCGKAPGRVNLPGKTQQVVVLPEIVRSARPIGTVVHTVALGGVVGTVNDHLLIQGVVKSQPLVIHILVCLDAGLLPVSAIHNGQVTAAGCHSVPGLAGVLVIANEFVTDGVVGTKPGQRTQITA